MECGGRGTQTENGASKKRRQQDSRRTPRLPRSPTGLRAYSGSAARCCPADTPTEIRRGWIGLYVNLRVVPAENGESPALFLVREG